MTTERAARERLGICLVRLTSLTPADLVRTRLGKSIFRSGLPHFERTLNLFRLVAQSNLLELPPHHLNIVGDDAEEALARFREIRDFTGEGVENPKQVGAAMIAAVRDAYPLMHARLSPLIRLPDDEPEVARQARWGPALAICLVAVALAGAIIAGHYAGYRYAPYTMLAGKVASAMR